MAGSLITVTSLTFSLTVLTLQLASSQFSPRLLRTFTRDRFVHVTLALFLGTFSYALAVLRTVRDAGDRQALFVPQISVTIAFVLGVSSVVGLVLFLAHLAREIRVETMLRKVRAEANGTVRLSVGWPDAGSFDAEALTRLRERVAAAIATGFERTTANDIAYGLRQLTDVTNKALSPGINDPTTASLCIDRIGEALTRVCGLRAETRFRAAPGGTGGVCYTVIGLDDILDECIPQIRHFGADDVLVGARLLTVLGAVAAGAESPAVASLAGQARLVAEEAIGTLAVPADRRRISDAAAWAAADGAA